MIRAVVFCLQANSLGQVALLVVFDQVNAEAIDELKVCFRKGGHPRLDLGAEAAVFDLVADVLGWIL